MPAKGGGFAPSALDREIPAFAGMEKWGGNGKVGGNGKGREWKGVGNGKGAGVEKGREWKKGTEMDRGAGMEKGEREGHFFRPKPGKRQKKHGVALSAI